MVLKLWVYTHLFSLNSIKTHFSSGTVDYFLFLFHFEHPRKMHLKFFQLPDEEFVNCILRFYITCHYMQPSLASCCFIIYFILTSFVCIMQFFVLEKKNVVSSFLIKYYLCLMCSLTCCIQVSTVHYKLFILLM